MAKSNHVVQIKDVFYTENNTIGIVTDYHDNSLDKVLQSNMPKVKDNSRFEESDSDDEKK